METPQKHDENSDLDRPLFPGLTWPVVKKYLKTASGFLIGGLLVANLFFSPPYWFTAIFNLCLYVGAAVFVYLQRKDNYYPDYDYIFKLLLGAALLEALGVGVHYNAFGWSGSPRFILLVVADFIKTCFLFIALYLGLGHKSKANLKAGEATVSQLIRSFFWNAKKWAEGNNLLKDNGEETDSMKLASDIAWACYHELRRRGEVRALRKLLNNKECGVRVLTARHLLWTDEADALRVLNEASRGHISRVVKKLERIEIAQLAVSSILFKSLSLKLP